MLVPALVKTKKGDPVFTLTADSFVVTDDGVEQKVRLEEDSGSQPLALVIVVETGGDGARYLDAYHDLGTLLESMVGNVRHRVAVVSFDSEPELVQNFNHDFDLVQTTLNQLEPGNNGAATLDALGYAVDMLRKQPPNYRRAILLLSETVDQGSHIKIADALRVLSDTNTSIYSIAFSSSKDEMKQESRRNDCVGGSESWAGGRLHGEGSGQGSAAGGQHVEAGLELRRGVVASAASGESGVGGGQERAAEECSGDGRAALGRGVLFLQGHTRPGSCVDRTLQSHSQSLCVELHAAVAASGTARSRSPHEGQSRIYCNFAE